jgi:hypothetical protein
MLNMFDKSRLGPFHGAGEGFRPLILMESLARDKHSSLLQNYVNYSCKKFYSAGPWTISECYEHFLEEKIVKNLLNQL